MITPTQSNAQPTAQQQPSQSPQQAALASDFETFLLLLTTQARNQDPLEPLDSSEYASQLAQFSMVEQQVQTNDLLSGLSSSLGGAGLENLATWVGMDVRSASAFRFDGAPVTLFGQAAPAADEAFMVIRNDEGDILDRITIPTNQSEFVWAGTDSSGNPLPAGTYSATIESYDEDELLSQELASAYNQVIEAQAHDGAIMLTLGSGQVVAVEMVTGVRSGA